MKMRSLNIDIENPSLYNSITATIEGKIRFRQEDGPTIEDFFYNVTAIIKTERRSIFQCKREGELKIDIR